MNVCSPQMTVFEKSGFEKETHFGVPKVKIKAL